MDLKTEDVMKKLFPKKVIERAKKVAHEKDDPEEVDSRKSNDSSE